jgi:hypothetical protein
VAWTFDDAREDVKREVLRIALGAPHRETSTASFERDRATTAMDESW